jgi:hypothetical protein
MPMKTKANRKQIISRVAPELATWLRRQAAAVGGTVNFQIELAIRERRDRQLEQEKRETEKA